jgi:hypothetical protein
MFQSMFGEADGEPCGSPIPYGRKDRWDSRRRVPRASARAIVRKIWEKALEGDLASVVYLSERVEGKPRAIVSGDSNEPIAIAVSRGADAASHIMDQLRQIGERGSAQHARLNASAQPSIRTNQ